MKVLIIAYEFPPLQSAGVQRVLGFVRNLPHFGVEPVVLTVRPPADSRKDIGKDLPPSIPVYRSSCPDMNSLVSMIRIKKLQDKQKEINAVYSVRRKGLLTTLADIYSKIMVPDAKVLWYPFAVSKAGEIFQRHKIDFVFSSSPRNTAHLIAYSLSKKYRVPMVADFRDPWTQGKIELSRPFPFKQLDLQLERLVIDRSRAVICVTEAIRDDFVRRYRHADGNKFHVVTNGFDGHVFQKILPHTYEKFTIVYTGKNYEGPGEIRFFIDLLHEFRLRHGADIAFHYIGSDHQVISRHKETNRYDFVESTAFMDHEKAISHMKGAHALYLYQHGEKLPPLTGKFFEYLGAGRPILAYTQPESEMARIIRETGSGITFLADSTQRLDDYLMMEFGSFINKKDSFRPAGDAVLQRYERKNLTEKLASIFNGVMRD